MKEYPILMNTEMVRATLEKRKTETRRPIKPQPHSGIVFSEDLLSKCPYKIGQHLWVRETWMLEMNSGFYDIRYKADGYLWDCGSLYQKLKNRQCWIWRPSIHMPRWASRTTLEIVHVRVERLRDMSEHDAIKEGFAPHEHSLALAYYIKFWNSLYIKKPEYQWEANPDVRVTEFVLV